MNAAPADSSARSAVPASSSSTALTRAVKRGLLLINLGTPDAPQTPEVRRYLREFLSDPRVLDLPPAARWALLHLVILPTRPRKSAEAYRKIWMPEGSPLLVYSRALAQAVQTAVGDAYTVALGMRYGNPSLSSALDTLRARGVTEITLFPLYPQYAASSTGSSLERAFEVLGKSWNVPAVKVVAPFFAEPSFLDAFAEVARPVLQDCRADHVLFSFHGLPERQIRKSDETGRHCFASEGCCDAVSNQNRYCYRAQSFHTARELAARLLLPASAFSVSFQSRLGRTPWIRPYSDEVIPELARRGVRRLAVMCPAFVADCLETVEEVALRGRDLFLAAGGEALTLVPSLNAHPAWVRAVIELARRA